MATADMAARDMGATTTEPVVVAPIEVAPSGRSLGWWGTITLIVTEGMLFALLLFGNFYLRARSAEWPQGGIEKPELFWSGIRTALLLGSTIPAIVAERAAKRGRRGLAIAGLTTTILLGVVFLIGHVLEYRDLLDKFQPSSNAYGSVFYTITTLHAIHVVIGVVILGFLLWRFLAGRFPHGRVEPVENGILYWHFVDVVWVFVYSSLYLSVSLR